MKKVTFLFAMVFTIFSCQQSDSQRSLLRFVIDRNMTEKQLTELIASANSVNIKLDVHVESYDKQGRIKKINGDVEFGETGSGIFNSDNFGKIIITQDMNSVNSGFSIIVRKKLI
jgi:hypothetical protein